MGRRPAQLSISKRQRAELQSALNEPAAASSRIRVILQAAEGIYTLDDLARRAGRARSTIQAWIDRFKDGGVRRLIERGTPPGRRSPLGAPSVRLELLAGLRSGRWRSAAEVAGWLRLTHGIERSRKSIYYWFAKLGQTPDARTPTRAVRSHKRNSGT